MPRPWLHVPSCAVLENSSIQRPRSQRLGMAVRGPNKSTRQQGILCQPVPGSGEPLRCLGGRLLALFTITLQMCTRVDTPMCSLAIFDFLETPLNFGGVSKKPLQSLGLRKVSVLLTSFSQLGERDLFLLFFSWYKTYRLFCFASTCKSNSADFGKRWFELDLNVCERKDICGYLDLYSSLDLDMRRNSYTSKSV